MSKSKKHKSTGPKSRSSRPASSPRPDASSGATGASPAAGRSSREAKSTAESRLLAQFARWYTAHLDTVEQHDSHGDVEAVEGTLDVLIDMTRMLGPRMTLALPTARTLQALINHTIKLSEEDSDFSSLTAGALAESGLAFDDGADGDDDRDDELELSERIEALVDVLEHYLDFLSETSSWRASDDEYNASYAVLAQAINDLTVAGAMVGLLREAVEDIDEVDPAEQLLALNALPIIAGVDGVIEWLGAGRAVTEDGSMLLDEIQQVAALIGIRAVGVHGADTTDLAHHLYEVATEAILGDDPAEAEPQQASSVWDVSALGTWWATLSQVGIIDVDDTTVRPGSEVNMWRSADAAEQLSFRSHFVDRYVQEWLEHEAESGAASAPHTLTRLISMFVGAVSPHTLPMLGSAAVAHVVDEELHYDSDDAPAVFAASLVMHQLTKAGLFETHNAADGTARSIIPEALRPTLARTISPLVAALI